MEDFVTLIYGGKKRKCYPVSCRTCGETCYHPLYVLKRKHPYCSDSCYRNRPSNRVEIVCSMCGITATKQPSHLKNSRSGLYFCSRKCKDKAQTVESGVLDVRHYGEGLTTYRDRALAFYGEKCQVCGYNQDVRMLDVDHKDSNRKNAALENLQVLCVWCHVLKTRKVPYHDR